MEKIKIFKLQVEKTSIGNNIPELKGMNVFGSSERTINGVDYVFIEYVPDWVSYESNIKRVGEYIEVQTPYNEKDYIRDAFIEYSKQYEDGRTPSDEDFDKLVDKLYDNLNSGRYKGILIEPVRHSLPELLNELKYGRTSEDQKFLKRCVDLHNNDIDLIESYIAKGDTIMATDTNGKVSIFNVDKICVIPDEVNNYYIFTLLTYDGTTTSIAGNLSRFKNIKVLDKSLTAKSENGETMYFDKQGNLILTQ